MPERSLAERRISPSQPPSPTMKVSERLAALHIASLWCIAVAQPLFDVLRGSPEFFVAHDATPADLVGLVLLFCLAGPAIAALALWIVGRLAPGWRAGATGIMVGSLAAAVVLAALKPLGGWDPGLPLALAAGCGAAAGFAYIRLAPLCLFATFLSPALVVVPAAFLLTPGIAGLLAAADEESALDVAFGATPPVVIVIFDQLPLISLLDADGRIDPAPTARRAGILSDLAVVYLAVILPDDLAARLPPVTQGWRDFTARTTFTERFFAPRPDPRDTAAAFLDSVSDAAAGDRPPLYFLHVLLPHHPWMLLRTGQRFTLQRGDVGLSNERWLDDEWAATIRYQRHLLQLQYVDTRAVRRHYQQPLGRVVRVGQLPADAAQPRDPAGERDTRPRHQ